MNERPLVVLLHGVQSSSTTFWRVGADLRDLGCEVLALDLPGHGGRPVTGHLDLAALAGDVAAQLDERAPGRTVDVLVGHSLGALTALTLAGFQPDRARALVVEDPPAIGPTTHPQEVAAAIERDVARARTVPDDLLAEYRAQFPLWADQDVQAGLANLQAVDVEAVTTFLRRAADWDIVALIKDCPVPLTLIIATAATSALAGAARAEVLTHLSPERVVEVEGGHSVHRDRPGVWVATVLREVDRVRRALVTA